MYLSGLSPGHQSAGMHKVLYSAQVEQAPSEEDQVAAKIHLRADSDTRHSPKIDSEILPFFPRFVFLFAFFFREILGAVWVPYVDVFPMDPVTSRIPKEERAAMLLLLHGYTGHSVIAAEAQRSWGLW